MTVTFSVYGPNDNAGDPVIIIGPKDLTFRTDLASTSSGKGAALVGVEGGGTVQDALPGIFAKLEVSGDQSSVLAASFVTASIVGHRRVELPAGTFSIKDVAIPSNMHLRGKGMDETVLQRAGSLTTAILTFASGGHDITISDLTIDGASAADAKSLVSMGAHGGNIRFERVRFQNGCDRWSLRGDPIAQFDGLTVIDCEFVDCPQGGPIILAGHADVAGSSNISFIRNKFLRCGSNLCSLRPSGASFQYDFWENVKFNYNSILNCTDTGTNGPIPVEIWGATGFEQIGNYLNSGTRGLSAGEGQKNGVIAHNIICNQTAYAMEGGNNANGVHIHSNIAINCASFLKDTGTAATGNETRNVVIENNMIIGTGLASYDAGGPSDTIFLGNDNNTQVNGCAIRNNRFYDLQYARNVIRCVPIAASSSRVDIEGNTYISTNSVDCVSFINMSGINYRSRNNHVSRSADFTSSHHGGSQQQFYGYVGRTAASGANCSSDNDTVEMTGAVSSGSLYAIGAIEAATARYGLRVSGFRAVGNFTNGPFYFKDSTGGTILEGFDLRGITAGVTSTNALNNIHASIPLGLVDGTALIQAASYVKAGLARARRMVFSYEGGTATRTVKIRCDAASGAQAAALFRVDYVCANNNGAPSANSVLVGFSSASAPASSPNMSQGNGTAATLGSATDGSGFMVATITLPTSNNTWHATITADAAGNLGNGLNDYSVQVG